MSIETLRVPGIPSRSAFTLIEMVMVLVVLAILATVAVEMVEPRVDQARFEATQKIVRKVEEAIAAERTSADGTHTHVGFFIDTGGLPRAIPDPAMPSSLTLRDLWLNERFESFAIRPASLTQVANILDGSGKDQDGQKIDADSNVMIGSGWRGPYLLLPIGAAELRDGWGTRLVGIEAGADTPLRGVGDTDVTASGQEVIGVRSFGRDTLPGGTEYNMDLPATLSLTPQRLAGTVSGTVVVRNAGTEPLNSKVIVQLYYPDAATGLVRVERATVESLGASDTNEYSYSFEFKKTGGDVVLFPIGPRAVRAYFDEAPVDTAEDYSTKATVKKSRIRELVIQPTTNGGIELTIDLGATGTG